MKKEIEFSWKLPADFMVQIIPALIFLKKRNFRDDSIKVFNSTKIKIDSKGANNIPAKGPVLFLVNHFSAPGFSVLWLAMSMAATCPKNITWAMTDAWTFPKHRIRKLAREISHVILTRIAKVYGFFPFQPIADEPINVIEQSLAVRRILYFARDHPESMLGIAPEGRDNEWGKLGIPPRGAGLLINAFTKLNYKLIPVGFYATPEVCHLNFGKPLVLNIGKSLEKDEIDRQTRRKVMHAIKDMLPK